MRHLSKQEIEIIVMQEILDASGWFSWFMMFLGFAHIERTAEAVAKRIMKKEMR